jgi:hypothetical protein
MTAMANPRKHVPLPRRQFGLGLVSAAGGLTIGLPMAQAQQGAAPPDLPANAIFAATGRRISEIPFTRERVLEALKV